jgi:oxygen-dependent protoporphyrinogen oxidase
LSPTAIADTPEANPFLGPPDIRDAATVMVVNLYYSNPNLTNPYRGFGYLIPQSIPMEQNPERALGVIFASETSGTRNLDASPSTEPPDSELTSSKLTFSKLTSQTTSTDLSTHWPTNHQDTAPGTKLTVMLGGHWWSSWSPSDIPLPATAIEMAKSVLARHMQIYDEPLLAKARLQKDAIPQYRVGYRGSMAGVHGELEAYRGRIRVAGPAWQGAVGVNDCVRRAWEVVEDLGGDEDMVDGKWKTGLEQYTKKEQWFKVSRKEGGIVIQEDATA